jgi:hypothetical protein
MVNPTSFTVSNIFAEKTTFEDELMINDELDSEDKVGDNNDDDNDEKARGDIKIIENLDSDADEISEDPDSGGDGGMPFTCESGKCSCLGAADCFSMGRADVCSGGIDCQEGNSCTCVMK